VEIETNSPAIRTAAAIVALAVAMGVWVTLPLGPQGLQLVDLDAGVLYVMALWAIGPFSLIMAGWHPQAMSVSASAIHAVSHTIAYRIPQLLAVLVVVMLSGSLSFQGIVLAQSVPYLVSVPLAALIFFLAGASQVAPLPFGLAEAGAGMRGRREACVTVRQAEVPADRRWRDRIPSAGPLRVGGTVSLPLAAAARQNAEQSGTVGDTAATEGRRATQWGEVTRTRRHAGGGRALHAMAIAGVIDSFTLCVVFSLLFLGGWRGPWVMQVPLLGVLWLLLKAGLVHGALALLRAATPRLRIDQLLASNWGAMVPLALVLLMAVGLVEKALVTAGVTSMWRSAGLLATNAVIALVAVVLWPRMARAQQVRRPARVSEGR
jgi:NADH:ubiquinone oxidoreductase subunit H